jgi:flagellar biogenesis protein FliO
LRLCETLPLGERRFVAVIEFEESRFLLGGTSSSLVLLSRLDRAREDAQNHSEEERRAAVPFKPNASIMSRLL